MHAKDAYLFRHALVRDAAYQLQLPSDRAKLHRLAFEQIELAFGPRPSPSLATVSRPPNYQPVPIDQYALELAEHARLAQVEGVLDPCLRLVERLYLHRAGEEAEGAFKLEEAEKCFTRLGQLAEAEPSQDDAQSQGQCAIWLLRAGRLAKLSGAFARAERVLRKSSEVARQCGNDDTLGGALVELASALMRLGGPRQAEEVFKLIEALALRTGTARSKAVVLQQRAGAMRMLGRAAESESAYLQASELFRSQGLRREMCANSVNLSGLWRDTGRTSEAIGVLKDCLATAVELGDVTLVATTLEQLGSLESVTGKPGAEEHLKHAINLARSVGNARLATTSMGNLACCVLELGRLEEGLELTNAVLAQNREAGSSASEANTLVMLANIKSEQGKQELAEANCQQALTIYRRMGVRRGEGVALGSMGLAKWRAGDVGAAIALWENALLIHREVKNTRFEGIHGCRLAVGFACRDREWSAQARDLWQTGVKLLKDFGDQRQLSEVRAEMLSVCSRCEIEPLESAAP